MIKNIFTSYYSNIKNLDKYIKFGISLYIPNNIKSVDYIEKYLVDTINDGILHLKQLAPSKNLLNLYKNKEITTKDYSVIYIELLKHRKLSPDVIIDKLPNNSVLLCYEKTGFCHRHVLSDWIFKSIGFKIKEI